MLDGRESIKWSELDHAYGRASDVPGLLRDLAAGRHNSLDTLFTNIWHQGTVYGASAPAVPFLIEILSAPGCSCRRDILDLLKCLATGNSHLSAPGYAQRLVQEQGPERARRALEHERDWRQEAHAAVVAGVPVYLGLLGDRDPTVRATLPHLLSARTERAAEIEPALFLQIRTEPDVVLKASAVVGLGELWTRLEDQNRGGEPPPAERSAFFANLMRPAREAPLVRFVAALEVVRRAGADSIDEALDVFRVTVEEIADEFAQITGQRRTPNDAVRRALEALPDAEVRWLLGRLRHPDPRQRLEAVHSIEEFCRRWRFAPARVVPGLVELLTDPEKDVRERVARALPGLGRARFLAVERLGALVARPDETVRNLAQQVLTDIRERKNAHAPENRNELPRTRCDVSAMIRLVEEKFDSRKQVDRAALADAARCMRLLGREAVEAVPALQRCLGHHNRRVRIRSAEALWAIGGNADAILSTVLKELEEKTVEIPVVELVGVMRARSAVPALQRLVSAETRQAKSDTPESQIDRDEALVEEAGRALERIESGTESVE